MWAKDFKNYFWLNQVIPSVTATGATSWTNWFNYSDFGEHFKEFTFVFNYTNVDLQGAASAGTETLGMSIDIEWDPIGNQVDKDSAATDIILTETDNSDNQLFSDSGNIVHLVPDIDLASGAVSSANIMKFRFKIGWDMNTGDAWSSGTIVKLAIIPM